VARTPRCSAEWQALLAQQRFGVDLGENPDILRDHPELECLWAKLVDEYDVPQRGTALKTPHDILRGVGAVDEAVVIIVGREPLRQAARRHEELELSTTRTDV
jgi:hypothetical protein